MKLEICANSYQSVINAEMGQADRIELCSELSVGGITPSYGLLKKVSEEITIPVHVLIRPRSGNFYYTEDEFQLMKSNIKLCKELGFNGIVSGVLNTDNSIEMDRTSELIALAKPLSFTFHRAFDCVSNPKKALEKLIDLKVDRILTSGLQAKAENGIMLLKELQKIAKDSLIILPGSGIHVKNAHLFKDAGFKEIHTSASKISSEEKSIFFGNNPQTVSDTKTIKEILKVIINA
ncbi:copper homeostasis protein CutC [Polaribacter sp. IC073]|uniref:copper homeostasis protein CutC n=1 Tax=Polaribacter sp. IC073 TaxID=2508540 RepID=UPI0011BE9B15|nr:copper homeostasis protein CutC [Polaribacter sp. IC073]TXD47239.1 copper homeostasis protein CutC [Polaribacter sp. IC073]